MNHVKGMPVRPAREQTGAALIIVLLIIVVLSAVAGFMIMGVNRNTELGAGFQKNVAGLHAAEAGLNVGAAQVLTAMQNYGLPQNCTAQTLAMSGRTVTYTVSVPGGTAGSCTESPQQNIVLPAGDPYAGLNADVYTYNLTSQAVNSQGYTEANATMQFQARFVPLFQFLAFYQNDFTMTPGDSSTYVSGRIHTNGDMYLNQGYPCSPGLVFLGQLTIVGSGNPGTAPLTRGYHVASSTNHGNVWISLDGTTTNKQILGSTFQGDLGGCLSGPPFNASRQISQSEVNSFNGRIQTGLKPVQRPGETDLLCTPWTSCPNGVNGTYWTRADLRIVLDVYPADMVQLVPGGGTNGPALFPVQVLAADNTTDAAKTTSLKSMMKTSPGIITYTDVPTAGHGDCFVLNGNPPYPSTLNVCESHYKNRLNYNPTFPTSSDIRCTTTGYTANRDQGSSGPRNPITAANYCYDYRYGGFYDWREGKPRYILNVDWMGLEEWNRSNGNALFDPAGTTNGGLVIFFTVKGPNSGGANNYGVRIFDAARVRYASTDNGILFASDQGLYIAGNFNCPKPNTSGGTSYPVKCDGTNSGSNPNSDTPTYKKPVAVVADTITALSCGYVWGAGGNNACGNFSMDTTQWAGVAKYRLTDESSTDIPIPDPSTSTMGVGASSNTYWATAVLSGVTPDWCPSNHTGLNCSGASAPWPAQWEGGGLEAYFRYVEKWQFGPQFWFNGSLVNNGSPLHTCFSWVTQITTTANDAAYPCTANPPPAGWPSQGMNGFYGHTWLAGGFRRWFYDTSFDSLSGLPPLTPRATSLKEVYFTEMFQ